MNYYINKVNFDYYSNYLKSVLVLEDTRKAKNKKLDEEYEELLKSLEN